MSSPAPRRFRALLPLAALALAFALAGCAQEGKLIETPLPVTAVATDYDLIAHTDTTATINVRFKIVTHVKNPCESQHNVLELRRIDGTSIVYQIIPLARYNADDKCTQSPPGELDTALVLNVNGLIFGKAVSNGTDVVSYSFQVETPGAASLTLVVDSLITDTTPGTAQFVVRVEDATTGGVLAGANVAIDQLGAGGSATPLDSALTDAGGLATITVPAPADTAGGPSLPYRARVTSGASLRVVSVPSFPARILRREKLVVRI
jgi:hypothetical protein